MSFWDGYPSAENGGEWGKDRPVGHFLTKSKSRKKRLYSIWRQTPFFVREKPKEARGKRWDFGNLPKSKKCREVVAFGGFMQ